MSAYKNLFSESKCLSRNQLLGYLHGKLDAEEVYAIESHLNDCELCSAAIDGLMARPEEETRNELNKMKQQWEEKLALLPKDNKTIPPVLTFQSSHKNRWMIAASVVVLLGLAGLSVYSYFNHQKGTLSKKEESSPGYSSKTNSDNEINQIQVSPQDLKNNEKEIVKDVPSDIQKAPIIVLPQTTRSEENTASVALTPPVVAQASKVESKVEDRAKSEEEDAALGNPATREDHIVTDENKQKEVMKATVQEPNLKKPVGGLSNGYKTSSTKYSPVQNQTNYYGQENNSRNEIQSYNDKKKDVEIKSLTALQEGMQLYNSGSYRKCIKTLKKSLDKSNGQELEDMHYYLALAYTQMGEYENATVHYTWLKSVPRYTEAANKALIQYNESKPSKK